MFGGRSAEHEVSLVSAASVIAALDKEKYEVIPIGISPTGRWLSTADALMLLKEKRDIEGIPEHVLAPDPHHQALIAVPSSSSFSPIDRLRSARSKPLDVIFPLVHGTYGEDGTIQGLFELADVPYVGAGVLGSALGMDKAVQKALLSEAGIPVARSLWFTLDQYRENSKRLIAACERIRYPLFVKPANGGSSIGITKAHSRRELGTAISFAGAYDAKILVEECVRDAREIECGVLGNEYPEASLPGEIIPSNEFYDYDAKYVDGKSTAVVPAALPGGVVKTIQRHAVRAFKVLECSGMARVDFLVTRKSSRIYLNEINTIPGFTPISMFPKMWEASGVPYAKLLDRLIDLAFERHGKKRAMKTHYTPKSDWYR